MNYFPLFQESSVVGSLQINKHVKIGKTWICWEFPSVIGIRCETMINIENSTTNHPQSQSKFCMEINLPKTPSISMFILVNIEMMIGIIKTEVFNNSPHTFILENMRDFYMFQLIYSLAFKIDPWTTCCRKHFTMDIQSNPDYKSRIFFIIL